MEAKYKFTFVKASATDADGQHVDINWKAYEYQDAAVYWEARMVFGCYNNGTRKDMELHKWIKKLEPSLNGLLAAWGVVYNHAVKPSFKAAAYRSEEEVLDPHVRNEWTMSTIGVLALLVLWSTTSHSRAKRVRASAMLSAWMSRLLEPSLCTTSAFLRHVRSHASSCQQGLVTEGVCTHLVDCCKGCVGADQRQVWNSAADIAASWYGLGAHCKAASACLSAVAQVWSGSMDQRLGTLGLASDVTKETPMQGPKRKLRVDEDLRHHYSQGSVRSKRVHSGAQLAKATADVAVETARRWDDQTLLQYRAAAWATFEEGNIVSIASDGSRIGDPAEETIVFIAWDAKSDRAVFLPPQAFSEHTHNIGTQSTNGRHHLTDCAASGLSCAMGGLWSCIFGASIEN